MELNTSLNNEFVPDGNGFRGLDLSNLLNRFGHSAIYPLSVSLRSRTKKKKCRRKKAGEALSLMKSKKTGAATKLKMRSTIITGKTALENNLFVNNDQRRNNPW